MLPFYARTILFISIWVLVFLSQVTQSGALLIFFCAFSLAIYFFIPIFKRKLIPIVFLEAITLLYCFLFEEHLTATFLLLILLYCFDSTFYLKPFSYRIKLIPISFILLMYLFFVQNLPYIDAFNYAILILLLLLVLLVCNALYYRSSEQKNLYEELLDEYRKIKRSVLRNEKATRIEERARIAREMHDSVGHKLTALSMQIEMLLMKEENEMLRSMKNTVNESLEETRKAVRSLTMEDFEGISSVIQLIRKLESESQLRIHFTTKQGTLSLGLSNQTNIVLYRVLQESLTNAMKYGSSREVYVTLGVSSIGQLTFEIKNKFDSTRPVHEGFGLRNMRKRVEEIGGSLSIYQLEGFFILEGVIPVEEEKS